MDQEQNTGGTVPAGTRHSGTCRQGPLCRPPPARCSQHRPQVRSDGGQNREALGGGGRQTGPGVEICGGHPGQGLWGDQPDVDTDSRGWKPAHIRISHSTFGCVEESDQSEGRDG